MSRRRNSRIFTWSGDPIFRSRRSLPRPHEGVRRLPTDVPMARLVSVSPRSGVNSFVLSRPRRVFFHSTPPIQAVRGHVSVARPVSPLKHALVVPQVKRSDSVCVLRRRRRETLFALNRAGYSGSASKRHYQRTADSGYSCRR